jgi:hypothetical protein
VRPTAHFRFHEDPAASCDRTSPTDASASERGCRTNQTGCTNLTTGDFVELVRGAQAGRAGPPRRKWFTPESSPCHRRIKSPATPWFVRQPRTGAERSSEPWQSRRQVAASVPMQQRSRPPRPLPRSHKAALTLQSSAPSPEQQRAQTARLLLLRSLAPTLARCRQALPRSAVIDHGNSPSATCEFPSLSPVGLGGSMAVVGEFVLGRRSRYARGPLVSPEPRAGIGMTIAAGGSRNGCNPARVARGVRWVGVERSVACGARRDRGCQRGPHRSVVDRVCECDGCLGGWRRNTQEGTTASVAHRGRG